jgi:hypothetical protein
MAIAIIGILRVGFQKLGLFIVQQTRPFHP